VPSARKQLRELLDRRLVALGAPGGQAAYGIDAGLDANSTYDPDAVVRIDAEIARRFEKTRAVMITDTSGFTAQTKAHGVTHFLAKMRRLFRIAQPIIARHGAELVKVDADDLFIVCESADALLSVARDLLAALEEYNLAHTDFIGISVGLGHGPILLIERDLFGDAVNTASKLGEDIGLVGEILVTESFRAALGAENAAACTAVSPAEVAARGGKFPFFSIR
jgi:adenylate cyclase